MNSEDNDTIANFIGFLENGPSPYHAAEAMEKELINNNFIQLYKNEEWRLTEGSNYFIVVENKTVIAFTTGVENIGFKIIGTHIDSPTFKIKPKPVSSVNGCVQLGIDIYGGPTIATWTDRDLSFAGQVIRKYTNGQLDSTLVDFKSPALQITNLPIHLNSGVNEKGLIIDAKKHLKPLFFSALNAESYTHNSFILEIADRINCSIEDIIGYDLMLYDTNKPALVGDGKCISSARLDNLESCHAALKALISSKSSISPYVNLLVAFDNEEFGSESSRGASSPLLMQILKRISFALGYSEEDFLSQLSNSTCMSVDMAHAFHPNYPDKFDADHTPYVNKGVAIKLNRQGRYATTDAGMAVVKTLCDEVNIPSQIYMVPTGAKCGSTIGAIVESTTAIPTVDIGNPVLAMHSIRETMGTNDHLDMIKLLTHYLQKKRVRFSL